MKTLLLLRKKTSSSHFVGFTLASSVYFAMGLYLLYSPQSEKISLKQEGNHRFTLSMQTLQELAHPTPKKSHNHPKRKPPKPLKEKAPISKKTLPHKIKPQESITQEIPKEEILQTQKIHHTAHISESTNTQEALMHNEGVSHEFLSQIHSLISSHNPYPRMARIQRLEGEVIVEFILETNGEIKEVKIIQSNAKEILQKSALKALHKASRYFPAPNKRVKILVPILYKLH